MTRTIQVRIAPIAAPPAKKSRSQVIVHGRNTAGDCQLSTAAHLWTLMRSSIRRSGAYRQIAALFAKRVRFQQRISRSRKGSAAELPSFRQSGRSLKCFADTSEDQRMDPAK